MEKLNIAEILKNCPKGMELNCTMYEDVYFDYVDELNIIHCYIQRETHKTFIIFSQYGTPNGDVKSKCVILPKGKTTWEGFQGPFKDGDVVVCVENTEEGKEEATQIFILKSQINENRGFCYTGYDFKRDKFFDAGNWSIERLATEEEKQKLLKAIKDNGYKWNPETKTLDKLIEPKFKVGDKVKNKDGYVIDIIEIDTNKEEFKYKTPIGAIGEISFNQQNNYELVPNKFDITTLKPFDKILTRDGDKMCWYANIYSHYLGKDKPYQFKCIGAIVKQCIPYEGNEHLLGTTNDCDDFYKTWE